MLEQFSYFANGLLNELLILNTFGKEKAERLIDGAENGLDAVKKWSFYDDKKRRDIRVDVEILGGKAFVTIIILLMYLFRRAACPYSMRQGVADR